MEAREARNIQMLQEAIFEAEVASIKHRAAKKLLYQLEAEAQYKLQVRVRIITFPRYCFLVNPQPSLHRRNVP